MDIRKLNLNFANKTCGEQLGGGHFSNLFYSVGNCFLKGSNHSLTGLMWSKYSKLTSYSGVFKALSGVYNKAFLHK